MWGMPFEESRGGELCKIYGNPLKKYDTINDIVWVGQWHNFVEDSLVRNSVE